MQLNLWLATFENTFLALSPKKDSAALVALIYNTGCYWLHKLSEDSGQRQRIGNWLRNVMAGLSAQSLKNKGIGN